MPPTVKPSLHGAARTVGIPSETIQKNISETTAISNLTELSEMDPHVSNRICPVGNPTAHINIAIKQAMLAVIILGEDCGFIKFTAQLKY